MPRIPRFGRSDAAATEVAGTPDSNAAPDHDDDSPTVVMAVPEPSPGAGTPPAPDVAAAEAAPAGAEPAAEGSLGFAERARARRRLRFLRRARELGYRDLGGLVFDLHRFGRARDDLIAAKVHTLAVMDQELRALETLLRERRSVTVLHEPGIVACPRCAAIHGTESNYCPNCGLPTGGRADMPMAVPGAPGERPAGEDPPAAAVAGAAAGPAWGSPAAQGAATPPAWGGPSSPAPAEPAPGAATAPARGGPSSPAPAEPAPGAATPQPPRTSEAPEAAPPGAPDAARGDAGAAPAAAMPGLEPGDIPADAPEPSVWRAPSPVPGPNGSAGDDRPLQR